MDVGWSNGLLDVAHPQQNWQVGFNNGRESHSAFGVVSLYKPRLQVGLSSTDPSLTAVEWQEIDRTLRQALQQGIGGRTCVGYGSSGAIDGDLIFQCGLSGQGPAAKLLDDTAEFRPTMFRAAIRGMALRLFGGISDGNTAMAAVDPSDRAKVTELAYAFEALQTEMQETINLWEKAVEEHDRLQTEAASM